MKKYFSPIILFVLLFCRFPLFSQEGFQDIFDQPQEISLPGQNQSDPILDWEISGKAGLIHDIFFDQGLNSDRTVRPHAQLNLKAASSLAQVDLKLGLVDFDDLRMNEFFVRGFFSYGYLDAGLIKREWGKGDGYHVVDPLNALDQSEGIPDDLNSMKRPEMMLIWNHYLGETGLLELVYKPFYHPLETASDGRWAVKDLSLLPNIQPAPNGELWEYTQLAARLSGSLLRIDGGLIYYYGRFSEPGARIITEFLGGDPMDPANYNSTTHWTYTKAQLVGLEAAGVWGPFTLRGELGYWISEDRSGTVEYLYNDRLCWLGGVDLMLGGSRFFISLQEYGHHIMNYTDLSDLDVNRALNYKNQAAVNNLIAAVEARLFKEKLKLRISGITLLGTQGYLIMPELSWLASDNWEMTIKSKIFDGEQAGNNAYYAWRENDSLTLQISFIF